MSLRHHLLHVDLDNRSLLRDIVHSWHVAAADQHHPLEKAFAELVHVVDRAAIGNHSAARQLLCGVTDEWMPEDPFPGDPADPHNPAIPDIPDDREDHPMPARPFRNPVTDVDPTQPRRTLADVATAVAWPEEAVAAYAAEHGHVIAADDIGRPSVSLADSHALYGALSGKPWLARTEPRRETGDVFRMPNVIGRDGRPVPAIQRPGDGYTHEEEVS